MTPADAGLSGGQASQHLAATLAVMAWYVAAAAYGAACAMRVRLRHAFSPVAIGSCLALLATVSTLLYIGTWHGFEDRWYWSAQVMLAVLLAMVWNGAGMVMPAPAVRASDAQLAAQRQALITSQLGEMVAGVRHNAAVEAAVFILTAQALADEVRLLAPSAGGVDLQLLLTDVTRWLDGAVRVAGPDAAGTRLRDLAQEACALRRRFAQWRRI